MKRTFVTILAVMIFLSTPLTAIASFWDVYPDGYSLPGDIMVHADKDTRMMYLEYVGPDDGGPHIPEAYFLYYYGTDENGNMVPYPAYCMMPDKPGAGAGDHMVDASTYIDNPKIWGIVTNGYPYKTIGELGVTNKYEAYFATKMALWTYILDRDIDDWTTTSEVGADKVLGACKKIYSEGMKADKIPTPVLTTISDKAVPEKDSINSSYVSITYSVSSNMHIKGYKVLFNGDIPEGTIITDLQNNEKNVFNSVDSFKVMIPSDSIANATGTFEVEVTAELERKAIVHGVSYDKDRQDYALTIPVLELVYNNPTVTYTSQSTTLEIIKKAAGTNIPLAGAVFRVADSDGLVIGTFTTGSDGRVVVPLTKSGTYQIEEITPPKGYLLSEVSFRNINVSWEVATVTFTNERKPGLSIQKVDSVTGKRVGGAVVRIAKDGGSIYTDVKLDSSGTVYLDDMDLGTYIVTEIASPPGYVLDDTPQVVKLEPGKTATITLKNSRRPGITIRKYDEMTSTVLKGAEFSVAKKGGSIIYEGVTDENGMIQVTDLEPGWYTITELAPPEGYIITTQSKDVYLEAGKNVEVKFDNRRKPSLQITKLDEETKQPIEGAVFKLRRAGSSSGNEYITDNEGLITINDLNEGVYIVEEVKSPDGYLNENLSKEVELKWGILSQVVFTNKAEPALEILKVDEETSQPLGGARFRISETESGTIGDYITGVDGKIRITGLKDKIYTIEEITAPDGYLLDIQHRDVKLEWGKTTKLVFTNKAKPSLEILKIDEESRQSLEGAEFRITNTEGKTVGEYVTDKNGLILIRDLEESIYTVEEITAPDGYLLESQHKDIALEWGRTKRLVFTNKARPALEILKLDEGTRQPLSGAKYLITETEGRVVGEYITDEQGRIFISGLKDEIYTIMEIAAPDGYLLNTQHKDVKLEWGKTTSMIFTNKAKPSLEILKLDETTMKPLAGAKFRITATESQTTGEYATDDDGRILVTGLNDEIYTVEEITAPDGYLLDTQHKDILLEWGKTKQLIFTNKLRPSLEIKKIDTITGKPLEGARFRVAKTEDSTVSEYITDETGTILILDLEETVYTVEEITAPSGYLLNPQQKEIQLEWGKTKTLIYEDIRKPTLIVTKINALTYEPIPNTTYKIEYEDLSGGIHALGTYRTDSNGQIIIPKADTGWYIITETIAAPGYSLAANPVTRKYLAPGENAYTNLDINGTGDVSGTNIIELSGNDFVEGELIFDYPLNSIVIRKTHYVTGEMLAGAVFEVRRVTGDVSGSSGTVVGRYTTDSSGVIVISGLQPGGYIVEEVQAPPNFLLSDNSQQQVWLKQDGTSIVESTFANIPYGSLLITKADAQTGKPLANARFKVTDGSGAAVGNTNGEFVTDENGEILVSNVKPGSYVITEIEAPADYVIDTMPQTVNIGVDGKIYKVSFKNQPYGGILITKTDAQTGKPLANARFHVTDAGGAAAGNTNGEFITDENGEILIPKLKPGAYVVTEIEAPEYYAIDTTPQTLNVYADGKIYKVSFKNQPAGTLVIRKMDTVTKEPLADAWFKVTTAKGDVVGDANGIFKTDASGIITIPHLTKGSYIVEETKAPDGYILENQSQTIEVDYGRSCTLDFYNKKMSGLQIIKIDSLTKQPLKGAEFAVYKQSGELIGRYATDADGVIIIDMLSPGWYKAVETKTLTGYLLDDTPKDVQITANQFEKLVFENAPMSSLIIRKVDAGTREPLEGAEFTVKTAAGLLIGIYRSGTDGMVTIPALPPGWYSVTETKAPEGYSIGDNLQTVEITNSKTVTIEFQNRPYGSIVIKKIDEITGSSLSGADFSVYHQNGAFIGEYTSSADGTISIPSVEPGWYVIRETKAPAGYTLDSTAKTIEVKPAVPSMVIFTNKPFSGIEIMKIDSVTKEPLAGAAFIVERSNGEKIGTYKTDTAGKVIVPDLPEGTYIVSETTAPDGYMLSEVPKTVVVVSGRLSTIEFTNKPYSGIEIIKTDAVTHNPLAGATFTVERANGEKIGTYKSDSAGKIIVPDLKEGTYIVSEIIAPDGYMLNETPKTINVVSGKLATVTFVNKPHSGIEIIKTNSVTHDPLAGATFTVERVNGEKIGTYKTDSSGKIIVSDLPEGTYIVSETIAPDGYMLNESPKTVNVVSGKLVTVTFANKPYSGIEIIKTDSVTHDSLAGATFTVESVNGEKIGTYKTDSTGKIIVSDLPEGTYIVSETIAPDGYMLNESPKTVNVVSGKLATVMFANKPYSGIEIIKTDSVTHNPLAGATFTVESVNDEKIGTYKTDSSGKIIVSDLPEGTYIISETIAPNGYMLNESPKTVNVVSGKLATVTFANKPYSGIEIIKTDAVTHNPLAGATFTVEGVNGEKIGTYKTDSSGKIIVSDLPEGTYIISETIAPDGYMLNESPKTVNVVSGKLATVMFANKPYSGIEIIKTDSVTHNPLADATFTVEGVNGEKIGTYKTDSSGKIIVSDLPEGTYIVSETIAPDGYMLNESPKTVNVVSGKLATVTFANKPYSGIEIIKTDAVTHNPLSGAIFTVEHANGEKIGTYKTDSSGKVIVSELPEGTYIVSETIAPNGYILDGLPKTVIVKSGKLTIAEFANKPLAGLKIIKLDSVTHNPISGVEFVITKMTGEKIENDFRGYTFKTDRTGQIYVPGLMDGYYTVTEVKAAEGYILDGEPKTILIQSGKTSILEVYNTQMSGLLIIKTDAKTGKPLAGVVFDIRHADGSFVTGRILDGNQPGTEANSPNKTTSTNGDITGSYTTDANGRILLNGLESGQYMVTERKALDGYELDTDVYNVTVVTGKLATLNLTNKPKGGIRLVKIDSMTQKPIQGVEFMLFDSDKKVVDVFYTDDNGVIDISDGIAEGRYTIRETRAAKGYDLDTNPRTVEFKGGVVTEIVWENTPQLGQIQITKKSGDGNEINGMPKGTLLEGAVYEVYDYRTGNLVDRFVTGNNGVAVSSMLPLGRYLIKEVKAPQYYKLSGKVLDIEIEYSGQIIRREMVNYSVSLGVYIKKTGNYEAMSGDNIRYRVKAVQNTSNIALSDFYWRDVLPTDAVRLSKIVTGTYNQSLKYKIMATTSKGDSIIIADNLSTLKNHVIDCSRVSLGLAADEYVTSFTFVFGTVKAKFAQVEQPQVYVDVKTLPNKYEFANKCDVGGRYNGEWIIANSTWKTSIYSNVKLPKTGY